MRVRTYARRYGLVLLCAYACLCVGAVVLVGMWVGGCSCIPQGNTIGDLRATAVSILPNAELIAAGIWLTGLTRSSMGFRSDYKSQQGLELPSLLLARSRGGGKHSPSGLRRSQCPRVHIKRRVLWRPSRLFERGYQPRQYQILIVGLDICLLSRLMPWKSAFLPS